MPVLFHRLRAVWQAAQRRIDSYGDRNVFFFVVSASSLLCLVSFLDHSRTIGIVPIAVSCMVLAAQVLRTWAMAVEILVLAGWAIVTRAMNADGARPIHTADLVALTVVIVATVAQVVRRDALGLRHRSAESVLGEIRSQARNQNDWPPMPPGWCAEVALRPRQGAAVAGDFVSARVVPGLQDGFLELVVVDVSGHGLDAGPRALLLSGAVGGLLGAVPPDRLLAEVNSYVLRQRWGAGFATATYLRLDLDTYEYELRSAGHPPAVIWSSASRTASRCSARGTLLGVVEELDSPPAVGRLVPGDAIIFYTDGVVETRHQSLDHGIDKLAASVEEGFARQEPTSLADALVESGTPDDDRTVVVLWNNRAREALLPVQRRAAERARRAEALRAAGEETGKAAGKLGQVEGRS